jgi:hypothetical protein
VLAGPLEFGLLGHHPGSGTAIGSDQSIGQKKAAGIADQQARVLGAVQHPLVTGDRATAARLLRQLAPLYAELHASLPAN